jgi:hypothetical protein
MGELLGVPERLAVGLVLCSVLAASMALSFSPLRQFLQVTRSGPDR